MRTFMVPELSLVLAGPSLGFAREPPNPAGCSLLPAPAAAPAVASLPAAAAAAGAGARADDGTAVGAVLMVVALLLLLLLPPGAKRLLRMGAMGSALSGPKARLLCHCRVVNDICFLLLPAAAALLAAAAPFADGLYHSCGHSCSTS